MHSEAKLARIAIAGKTTTRIVVRVGRVSHLVGHDINRRTRCVVGGGEIDGGGGTVVTAWVLIETYWSHRPTMRTVWRRCCGVTGSTTAAVAVTPGDMVCRGQGRSNGRRCDAIAIGRTFG